MDFPMDSPQSSSLFPGVPAQLAAGEIISPSFTEARLAPLATLAVTSVGNLEICQLNHSGHYCVILLLLFWKLLFLFCYVNWITTVSIIVIVIVVIGWVTHRNHLHGNHSPHKPPSSNDCFFYYCYCCYCYMLSYCFIYCYIILIVILLLLLYIIVIVILLIYKIELLLFLEYWLGMIEKSTGNCVLNPFKWQRIWYWWWGIEPLRSLLCHIIVVILEMVVSMIVILEMCFYFVMSIELLLFLLLLLLLLLLDGWQDKPSTGRASSLLLLDNPWR